MTESDRKEVARLLARIQRITEKDAAKVDSARDKALREATPTDDDYELVAKLRRRKGVAR